MRGNYLITYMGTRDRFRLLIPAAGEGRARAVRFARERGSSAEVWYIPHPTEQAEKHRVWPPEGEVFS